MATLLRSRGVRLDIEEGHDFKIGMTIVHNKMVQVLTEGSSIFTGIILSEAGHRGRT